MCEPQRHRGPREKNQTLCALGASVVSLTEGNTMRLPLLITGITGVAGHNAFLHFRELYPGQVIGTRPRQSWQCVGDGIVAVDVEDHRGLRELFDAYRFPTVLNAVGNCALKSCELDPAMARLLNVESVAAI